MNGLLYVVGGDDGSCNLASVEYYNPSTDKWTLLPTSMSTGRSYAGKQAVGEWAAVGSSLNLRAVPSEDLTVLFCMFYVDFSRRNFHRSCRHLPHCWPLALQDDCSNPGAAPTITVSVCLFLQQVWL